MIQGLGSPLGFVKVRLDPQSTALLRARVWPRIRARLRAGVWARIRARTRARIRIKVLFIYLKLLNVQ